MADSVEMQGIEFQIVNDSDDAAAGIDKLANSLSRLKLNISGSAASLSKVAAGITQVKNAALALPDNVGSKLDSISTALGKLSGLKVSSSIGNQLKEINNAAAAIPADIGSKLGAVGTALKPLSELGKSSLSSFTTQLGKLPKIIEELDKADLNKFTQQMKDLAEAIKPLADEMNKVAAGFSAFPARIQNLISSTQQYNGVTRQAAQNTNNWNKAMKAVSFAALYRGAVKLLSSAINKSSEYQEDMNLFTVSMGQYAEEAYNYAQTVSEIVGIDPAEWMRNQGTFNTIITGFGVAGDKAAFMSKNLTQLGYDIASFYNIDFESAMQKVQSGIAGELEPLRRLGYDLSVARLEQERLNLGIDKSVSSMTQAEKSQLRYYAIMTQVTQVQGDMARTLNNPANQLRVLTAQFNLAAREIGNIFIPALNAILPVAIAVAKAIRAIAQTIANVFGVKLPSVDYSGISSAGAAAGDLSENLDEAGSSADNLKNKLAGFDELNVIQSQSGGGGGGGGGGIEDAGNLLDDIELPGYDFLGDAIASNVDKVYEKMKPVIEWITDHLKEIAIVAGTIGATILAWAVASDFSKAISLLKSDMGALNGAVLGIASAALTVEISYMLTNKGLSGAEEENHTELIASGLTSALGSLITGSIVKSAFGADAGIFAGATTLMITAATDIYAIYNDVKNGGFDAKTIALGVWDVVKGAIAGGLVATALGASVTLGVAAGGGLVLAGVLLAIKLGRINVTTAKEKTKIEWGDVELTKKQISKLVEEKLFSVDVSTTLNVIDARLSSVEGAKNALKEQLDTFSADLTMLKFGVDVEGSMANMLNSLTGGATDGSYTSDSILGSLESLLSETNSEIKLGFAMLAPDSGIDITSLIDTSDSLIQSAAQSMGKQLADLLSKGISEGLDENEQALALKLSEMISSISRSAIEGQIASDFAAKTALSLTDVTRDTFSAVLEEYQSNKEQLRQSYEELAISIQSDLGGRVSMLETTYEFNKSEVSRLYSEVGKANDAYDEAFTNYSKDRSAENKDALDEARAAVKEITDAWKEAVETQKETESTLAEARAAYDDWSNNIGKYVDDSTLRDSVAGDKMISEEAHNLYGGIDFDTSAMVENLRVKWRRSNGTLFESAEELYDTLNEIILWQFEDALSKEDYKTFTDTLTATGETAFNYLPEEIQDSMWGTMWDLASDLYYELEDQTASSRIGDVNTIINYVLGRFTSTDLSGIYDQIADTATGIDAGKTMGENIITGVEQADFHAAGVSAAGEFSSGFSSNISIPSIVNTVKSAPVRNSVRRIRGFASGGYPQTGELFVARENGIPEMVGQIGGSSAIANNDQIVDGIASGVAAANEEQNALLREQNALLLRLLQKEFTAEISPSADLGRVIARSSRMYERSYG